MKLLHLSLLLGAMPVLISPIHSVKADSISCPANNEVIPQPYKDNKEKWLFSGTSGIYEFKGLIDVITGVEPDLDNKESPMLSSKQIVGQGSFELTCSYKLKSKKYKNQRAVLTNTVNKYKRCAVENQKFECKK